MIYLSQKLFHHQRNQMSNIVILSERGGRICFFAIVYVGSVIHTSLMRCQRWMNGYSFSRGHRGSNRPQTHTHSQYFHSFISGTGGVVCAHRPEYLMMLYVTMFCFVWCYFCYAKLLKYLYVCVCIIIIHWGREKNGIRRHICYAVIQYISLR